MVKVKEFKCSECNKMFKLEETTAKIAASLRQKIMDHISKHNNCCDTRVVATNYRADYTCIRCGVVVRIGPNGVRAAMERMEKHRNTGCMGPFAPAEFLTQTEKNHFATNREVE